MTGTEIARALIDRVGRGDIEGAADLYAEDSVTWRNLDGRELSKKQVRKIFEIFSKLDGLSYEDVRIQELPSGFVQQHVLRCRTPSGEDVAADACLVVRVEDGKIVRIDEYMDSAAIAPLMNT